MNRRNFFKVVTGFIAGVFAAFAPKAKSKPKKFNLVTEAFGGWNPKDGYSFGWIHCWMDDWKGKIICHSCSSKDCDVRAYASKITNYPEHNMNDKLVVHCGWIFLYGKWKK